MIFLSFYTCHTFLHKTLVNEYRLFRCIPEIFSPDFLIFYNLFKLYFYNECICSYEPKHHVH
jgi:hypothetical protein